MKNPFLISIVYILIEIATFIIVGKAIGVLPTLMLVIATSAIGVYLIKKNGTKAFQNIKISMQQGQAPGVAMIGAFLNFIGTILFILPGFVGNFIGILMMTSFTRNLFKPAIFYWMRKKMKGSQVVIYQK